TVLVSGEIMRMRAYCGYGRRAWIAPGPGSGWLKFCRLVSTWVPLLPTQPISSTSLEVNWCDNWKLKFCMYALCRLRSCGIVTTLKMGLPGYRAAGTG